MNFYALCHIPKSNYAYARGTDTLAIRLRTARNDCTSVTLVIALKHRWEEKDRVPMQKVASDRLFDYYACVYKNTDTRLGYYFEISDGKDTRIYCESGIFPSFDDRHAYFHYFQYPYINAADVHTIPDWVHGAVFYEIFVERFASALPHDDLPDRTPWGEQPNPKSFFGGDLRGIAGHLDYLTALGVNALYLTPVFSSKSNHKYDTTDYRQVDPRFGGNEALFQLIASAHQRGLRVILDGVFNHSGFLFAPFQDVIEKGKRSVYRDWFHILRFPIEPQPSSYRFFGTSPDMPKLNTSNPELKKYLLDAVAFWTREAHIDGWRLDVSDEVDHRFWRSFRTVVKNINPNCVIIGENWHNAYPWLMGDQFDGVMNYPVTKACFQFFASHERNAQAFADDLSHIRMWYSKQANDCMISLLDSHDTVRFLTACGGKKIRLKLAILFLFSYTGMPCIYYGSEIGMEGMGDPDCRRTFDWNEKNWDHDLLSFYKKAIALRKQEPALQRGSVHLSAKNDVLCLQRELDQERLLTVINNTADSRPFPYPDAHLVPLLCAGFSDQDAGRRLALPPYSGALYRM